MSCCQVVDYRGGNQGAVRLICIWLQLGSVDGQGLAGQRMGRETEIASNGEN